MVFREIVSSTFLCCNDRRTANVYDPLKTQFNNILLELVINERIRKYVSM